MQDDVTDSAQGSVFRGATRLGTVQHSSSGCDDGCVPGTPVGYVRKSCDRWRREHSDAPTSGMLQRPKFKYMPQSTGVCIPLFQKLLS